MPSNITLEKNFFSSVLDSLDDDILLTGNNDDIVFCNIRARVNLLKILDLTECKSFSEFAERLSLHSSDKDKVNFRSLISTIEKGGRFISLREKINIQDKFSVMKTYQVISFPVYDNTIGMVGRLWEFKDVTFAENLESMKSEFIAIASHQLRTPLTSIRGFLDMILKRDYGEVPKKFEQPLATIKLAADQMAELINSLLNISRLERVSDKRDFQKVNIAELINMLIQEISGKALKKSIQIIFNTQDINLEAITDRMKIYESIKNLVDNAIKYSPENTNVEIHLEKVDEKFIGIRIKDHGIGIPQEDQDRLFEKFFRAENAIGAKLEGTGLGLYYVKKAITDIGGFVRFTSKEGEGTEFELGIPMTN